jgi:diacylglycerol kinase family enzyme
VIQALFSGEYDQQDGVIKHYQASEVSVRPLPAEKVQLDGDVVPMSTIRAKLVPDGISIIVPAIIAQEEEQKLELQDMKIL